MVSLSMFAIECFECKLVAIAATTVIEALKVGKAVYIRLLSIFYFSTDRHTFLNRFNSIQFNLIQHHIITNRNISLKNCVRK